MAEISWFPNQPVLQRVAKVNLCNSKLQEPFVPLCPLNKLSFCRALECVQPNCCTYNECGSIQIGRKGIIGTVF